MRVTSITAPKALNSVQLSNSQFFPGGASFTVGVLGLNGTSVFMPSGGATIQVTSQLVMKGNPQISGGKIICGLNATGKIYAGGKKFLEF